MSDNSITVRLAVLLALLEGREPFPKDCGNVSPEEFIVEVEKMDNEGIIANVKYVRDGRGKALVVFLKEAIVTLAGNAYIDNLMRRFS